MNQQRRRSRRHPEALAVQIVMGRARHQAVTRDVSRHGLFLSTDVSFGERQLVQLVLTLPDGALPATAMVSHVATRGVGLQLFALSAGSKERWDRYVYGLDRSWLRARTGRGASHPDVAVFLIRLRNVSRLLEFYDENVTRGSLYLTTPVLREQGAEVVLNIIHPSSEREYMLTGHVVRVCVDSPKGMEIHLEPMTDDQRARFREFVTTGLVPGASGRGFGAGAPEAGVLSIADDTPAPAVEADEPDEGPSEPEKAPQEEESVSEDISIDIIVDEGSLEDSATFGWSDVTHDDIVIDFTPSGVGEVKDARTQDLKDDNRDDGSVTLDVTRPELVLDRTNEECFLTIRCSACGADLGTARDGPAQGLLGTLASHQIYWWPNEDRIVSILRLDRPSERRRSRLKLGEAGLSHTISLRMAFKVADLSGPPRCPDGSAARVTDLVRAVKVLSSELVGSARKKIPDTPCPRCDARGLEVERWS